MNRATAFAPHADTKRVLVVMPESPYPPRRNGLALRYYPLLTRLSAKASVDLAVVSMELPVELGDLRRRLHRVFEIRRTRPHGSLTAKLRAHARRLLPFGMPFGYVDYGADAVAEQLRGILADSYDAVVWATQDHVMFNCLPALKRHRLIIDQVDSNTLHLTRSLKSPSLGQRLRIAKLRRFESRLMDAAAVGFYISPVDRETILPTVRRVKLDVLPNGVLIEDYRADKVPLPSPSIGFLGNMSYIPNIDAAHRVYRIYRALKDRLPTLKLCIIGRDPHPSFDAYRGDPDVTITGTVDNIWPYVNAVDLFLTPMYQGAGQQNKLLEVMYAGRPLVATSVANGGVLAVDGESIVIADDEETMREKALALLENSQLREQIAAGGARFVRERYGWDEVASRFAAAVLG